MELELISKVLPWKYRDFVFLDPPNSKTCNFGAFLRRALMQKLGTLA